LGFVRAAEAWFDGIASIVASTWRWHGLHGRLLLACWSFFGWTPTFSVLLGFAGFHSNTFSVLLEIAIDNAHARCAGNPATRFRRPNFRTVHIALSLPALMLQNSSTGKRLQPRNVFTASSSRTIIRSFDRFIQPPRACGRWRLRWVAAVAFYSNFAESALLAFTPKSARLTFSLP
jgi:hypothetical protein